MSATTRLATVGALCAILLVPSAVAADAMPHPSAGWYLPFGVNVGGSIHHDLPGGLLLGGEVSIVNYDEIGDGNWVGAYTDALWDFGPDEFRFSVGPEAGLGPLGLDVGYLGSVRDSTYTSGIVVRGMLTLSFVALYGRWGHEFTSGPANFGEVGALIKWPMPVGEAASGRPRRPEPGGSTGDADAGVPLAPPPPPPPPAPTLQVPSPEPPPEPGFATPP